MKATAMTSSGAAVGTVSGVRRHLHLNGAAILGAAIVGYATLEASWWLFFALLFVPDVWMIGYLANPRVGAELYNVGHSLVIPALLIGAGLVASSLHLAVETGVIYAAHIGLDRVLGFGYKYPTEFSDTDIGRA